MKISMYRKRIKLFVNVMLLFATLLLFSCNEKEKKEFAGLTNNISEYAVEVTMEGKVFQIKQENLEPIKKTVFKKDSILLIFWEDGNPLQLNLNLTNTDIMEKGTATYTIPEANVGKAMVDLNLFNTDRDAKRINKRIVFRRGTIQINKLTDQKLEMKFNGEGSGMMDSKNSFPITGKVNVTY